MKSAIITGVNGLIGEALAKFLIRKNVKVIGLSRNKTNLCQVLEDSSFFEFIELNLSEVENLPSLLEANGINLHPDCIFYHFGWGGLNKLTDGAFEDQFINAIYSAKAVQVASKCNCKKFINVGTIEESYLENVLNRNIEPSKLQQLNYAISKTASRDMSQLIGYLEKIDYIHTRISVPIDESLLKGGYITQTLRKIIHGEGFSKPQNNQYFDFIYLQDLCEAYYRIGSNGLNKANYYIGPGKPRKLHEYFSELNLIVNKKATTNLNPKVKSNEFIFKTESMKRDLNFSCQFNIEHLIQKEKKCKT
jgi:nucleoside-diphosphate-sugar epimerase